ncbi:hypothetical protein ACFQDE_11505 [Deinococcus caeni]|uniref:hypothetical protein n=1 Tax=Deinococcus caeni TaxID=569127 RepID=UPI00361E7D5D
MRIHRTAGWERAQRPVQALLLGWLATKAAVLAVNAVTFPRLRPAPTPRGGRACPS